jgi:plasmid stabilization system protein ParE
MPTFYLSTPARKSLKFIARTTEKKWGRDQRKKYLGALNARFRPWARRRKRGGAAMKFGRVFITAKKEGTSLFTRSKKQAS